VENPPRRDLEDRTLQFAQAIRNFVKSLPRNISNMEDVRQLVRASGSVAANWIEADEALSKKDFLMRVKSVERKQKKHVSFYDSLILVRIRRTGQRETPCPAKLVNWCSSFSTIISKSSGA
jgi:hypothetical protein